MKKKILALLLAATMALGMSMTVCAAATKSITITAPANANEAHTYGAYQIFTGDLTEDGKTLSNIQWGANIAEGTAVTYNGTEYAKAAELAKALSDETDAKAFATAIASYITGSPVATKTQASATDTVQFDLAPGYYLIKDESALTDDAFSRYMIQLAADVTVTAKADKPSTQKKIQDVNDSTGETTDWQDSADYDIGDEIPYQFTSTIVANIADYEDPYVYTFHDKQSAGLTFNADSVSVTVNGVAVPFTVDTNTADGDTFDVVTGDLRSVAKPGDVVEVLYTATLNSDAIIGSAGNPNTMYLEYSNNPNGEGTGKTPEDTVIAFTYTVEVDKVDEKGEPLSGAEFALEKLVNGEWVVLELVANDDKTVFTFKGLDDGNYRISETKTPAGYNTISDKYVPFVVTAQHEVLADMPQLTDLTGNVESGLVGEYKFVADKTPGTIVTSIVNQSGSILPSTGGIGTTIFYIVGLILVCGACIVLFVRKKMSAE